MGLTIGFVIAVLLSVFGGEPDRTLGLGYAASKLLEIVFPVVLGGLLGFVAATIRRRFTGED